MLIKTTVRKKLKNELKYLNKEVYAEGAIIKLFPATSNEIWDTLTNNGDLIWHDY